MNALNMGTLLIVSPGSAAAADQRSSSSPLLGKFQKLTGKNWEEPFIAPLPSTSIPSCEKIDKMFSAHSEIKELF